MINRPIRPLPRLRFRMIRLFFFPFLLCLLGCENDLADINRLFDPDAVAMEVAYDVEMLYSDSAVVQVRIRAPRMIRHIDKSEPRQEFPDGMDVDFFGSGQRVDSQLRSDYAIRFDKKKQIVVRDSVVWLGSGGEQLDTEELTWDERTGKVFTNRFVTLRRPEEIVYGVGFEANQDFSRATIKAVEGRIKVQEEQ